MSKKYVSIEKLGLYDEKIKKFIGDADAVALQSAKDYADGLATNYDAAGAAASALTEAKAYADGKDAAIAEAKKAGTDAAAAAAIADGKAVTAQGEVDALEALVGVLPEGTTATTVIEYVNKKTEGIATDAALGELNSQVSGLQTAVQGIQADYLKGSDKTALEGQIAGVQSAVDTEKSRAEGVESGLNTRIKAVEDDYLKGADKTELAKAISDEAERAAGVEGGLDTRIKAIEEDYLVAADKEALQNQINLIMNNPDTKDVIDSIAEFTQYVADHGTIAEGFRTDIDKNKEDIAANAKAIADQAVADAAAYATKTELANEKKALQDEIDADVKVVADDLAELEGVVTGLGNTKADKTYVDGKVEALQGVDAGFETRIAAIEGKFGEGDSTVEALIATAKQEAITAAASDATTKANTAESNAKTHANSLNTAMNARVEALEAIDHDHSNKAELDLIVSGDKAKWDEAYAKRHEHSNLTVLEGITAAKVSAWDAAEGNAKTYADGLNTAMNTRVETLETWHANFSECSEDDIKNLFA